MSQARAFSQNDDWKSLADILLATASERQKKHQESVGIERSFTETVGAAAELDELEVVQALGRISNPQAIPSLLEFRQIKSQDLILHSGEFWATIDCVIKQT